MPMSLLRSVAVCLALCFVLPAIGCGKSEEEIREDERRKIRKEERRKERAKERDAKNEIVVTFAGLADEACACKDTACATAVSKKFGDYTKKHADTKVTKGDADEIKKSSEKYAKCVTEVAARAAVKAATEE